MKKVKIYITEGDAEDLITSFIKGRTGHYATWNYPIEGTKKNIDIEIHLGNEDDQE